MAASSQLTATKREKIGKANRRLAADNQIPAVLYGRGRDPLSLAIDRHDFELFMAHHSAGSTMVELSVEGEKGAVNAMIRDVQNSPVKGTILHVDFLEVSMNKPIHAVVALHFVNDAEGVKAGGILTVNVHEVNIEAKPGDLPETLDVDVAALQVGDSITVADLKLAKGVTITDPGDTILASVQAPKADVEEAALEEGPEPELVGKSDAE